MAKKTSKRTARGRKLDGVRVAGGQGYEVGYEAKKTCQKAVKKVGNSRRRLEKGLER
jgi:hypothetical protein